MKRKLVLTGYLMSCMARLLVADSGTWTAATGGEWSDAANWNEGTVASNSGATATFTIGSGTISNDLSDLTLAGLQFEGGSYSLVGNAITLDSSGFLTVAGTQTVATALALQGDAAFVTGSGQMLNMSGAVSGSGGLSISGGRTELSNPANEFTGSFRHVSGLVSLSSVGALGLGTDALILGEGTFRYTGSDATLDRGLTLLPGTSTNRASAVDITDSSATLTVAGPVRQPGGAFIKTGDGTLALTYPGYQEFGKSRSGSESVFLAYDSDGIPVTNTYAAFVVEKGRLVIGAPGQSNIITASSGYIGNATLASPRMDIVGGITRFLSGWVTIGRGTGTAASPQSPSLYISNAVVYVEGSGLCMDNANGVSNHRCRPVLSVDHSLVQAVNYIFGENDYVTGRVNIVNGSHLICNQQTDHRYGMQVAQTSGANVDMRVTFDGASTNSTYLLRVNQGGKLTYQGNSVLALDHTQTNLVMSTSLQSGLVRFDGATLKQRTPQRIADWLINHTNLLVATGGLTINVDSRAWLDNALLPDPASLGGAVTKTGGGTLALGEALKVPLTVSEGAIALAVNNSYTNVPAMPSYTFASGSTVEVSGVRALLGYTFAAGSGFPTLDLEPNTFVQATERWTFNGSAMRRHDGVILLTRDLGNENGSAFLNRARKISTPWTAEFAWRVYSTSSSPADGFAFVLQNDTRGTRALGQQSSYFGYGGSSSSKISNSLAVGFDVYNKRLYFGTNGTWISTVSQIPDIRSASAYITVGYDGAGTLSVLIRSLGNDYTYTISADPVDAVGTTEAYVGLTAATGGSPGMHTFSAVTFDAGTPARSAARYAGATTLSAGETLGSVLHPTARQNGFVLGNLAFADGSILDVAADPVVSAPAAAIGTPPPLTDHSLWQLNGNAHWKGEGAVATSTNAVDQGPGSVFTVDRYAVTGSWVARFHYDVGTASTLPADYVCFMLQNESQGPAYVTDPPASGLAVQWRYYDGSIHSTRLKICTNGVTTVITDDIAPVTITNCIPADMTVAYDDDAHAITVTTVQSGVGTNVTVIPNINLPYILKGAGNAYIGFLGRTGGQYTENIISDFTFERADSEGGSSSSAPSYLAFDSLTGSGTLVKRGGAALGLLGDVDTPTSNLTVRLEEGGLVLRKAALEALDQNTGSRSDWVFSSQGQWSDDNNLLFCPGKTYVNGTATTVRRFRVADAWTATFTFLFGSSRPTSQPADAFCLFFHNDPHGPGYSSGNTMDAGFSGMQHSFGVNWYLYPGNTSGYKDTVRLGHNGVWDGNSLAQSFTPFYLASNVTDFVIHYDPAAATLTSIMTQGALSVTNIFTEVSIPSTIGSDYAYIGFGGGTGGAYWDMLVRDFHFASDAPADALSDINALSSLTLPSGMSAYIALDSSIEGATFNIPVLTLGEGADVGVTNSASDATLIIAQATLAGGATFDVGPSARCAAAAAAGIGPLAKTGAGTLALTGSAAYTGDTVLCAGTLALDAAYLPTSTDLSVTTGATLNLGFSGTQHIHALFVDGIQMPGGRYSSSNTTWITGDGVLVVMYPPIGTLFFMK